MSYKLKNTALDHDKRFLHRKASKMQMEPVIGGRRLRIRQSMVISDELFEHNRANLELWNKWGVVSWEKVGGEGGRRVPTKEEVMAAGYSEEAAESIIEREKRLAAEEAAAPKETLSEGGLLSPQPGEFDVWVGEVGTNQIGVVKALRESTQLSIKEASDLLGMAPVIVLGGVDEAAATKLAQSLVDAGAKASVQKSGTAPQPSLIPETLVPENYTPTPESKPSEDASSLFSEPSQAETTRVETKPQAQPKNPKSKK